MVCAIKGNSAVTVQNVIVLNVSFFFLVWLLVFIALFCTNAPQRKALSHFVALLYNNNKEFNSNSNSNSFGEWQNIF